MRIGEIIKDIFDDTDHHASEYMSAAKDNHFGGSYSKRRSNASSFGWFMTILPNIIGFVFGLAVAKLFAFSGGLFLLFGIVGAVMIGAGYSTVCCGVSFRYSVVRHCIIVAGIALIYGFLELTD